MASCPGTFPCPLPRAHDHQRQSHLPGHRPPGRGLPAHRVASPAGQPDGQRRDPRAHPAHRPRAELQGRQECLQPAAAQCRHPGPAVLRGPDQRRLADQPVLPFDAGLDHPRLRPARACRRRRWKYTSSRSGATAAKPSPGSLALCTWITGRPPTRRVDSTT